MTDIIIILVLLAIVAGIVYYLVREKKKGRGCTGCPYSGQCHGGCGAAKKPSPKKIKIAPGF